MEISLSSSPRPNADLKSCAIGPTCFTLGSVPFAFHFRIGSFSTRASASVPSTASKFSFAFRSLEQAHELPSFRRQLHVVAPVPASIPTTNRTPPVARALKPLTAVSVKSKSLLSAHTKEPVPFAFAR